MARGIVLLGSAGLVVLATVLAAMVLPACGLVLPFGLGEWRFCPAAQAAPVVPPERASLLAQIAEVDRRLAALECAVAPPPEPPPPAPEPLPQPAIVPEPLLPPPDAPLDPALLDRGDLGALRGCWSLGSEYAAVDPESGERIDFSDWEVCFGADGAGQEKMRGSDGATCEGPVQVRFDDRGALVIEEPGDLRCSNGFALFRREVRCSVDATGTADCRSLQPEVSGDAPVIMRRAKEQP